MAPIRLSPGRKRSTEWPSPPVVARITSRLDQSRTMARIKVDEGVIQSIYDGLGKRCGSGRLACHVRRHHRRGWLMDSLGLEMVS